MISDLRCFKKPGLGFTSCAKTLFLYGVLTGSALLTIVCFIRFLRLVIDSDKCDGTLIIPLAIFSVHIEFEESGYMIIQEHSNGH